MDSFGIVLGSCFDRFGIIWEYFGDNVRISLGSFWDKFGIILGSALATFFLPPPSLLPAHARNYIYHHHLSAETGLLRMSGGGDEQGLEGSPCAQA